MRQFEDKPQRRAEDSDHLCVYQTGNLRCQYPGAISHGILGGGPWYCRIHVRERGTLLAQQCLEQSQSYGPPRPNDDLKDLTWLAKHFPMQAGETRQEYNMRCKAYALSMLKGYRPKPVVNTDPPPRMREPGEDLVEF